MTRRLLYGMLHVAIKTHEDVCVTWLNFQLCAQRHESCSVLTSEIEAICHCPANCFCKFVLCAAKENPSLMACLGTVRLKIKLGRLNFVPVAC